MRFAPAAVCLLFVNFGLSDIFQGNLWEYHAAWVAGMSLQSSSAIDSVRCPKSITNPGIFKYYKFKPQIPEGKRMGTNSQQDSPPNLCPC